MITYITGKLLKLFDDRAILDVPPFHFEVWITEYTRRQCQHEIGKDVQFYTIVSLDGNSTQGRILPRMLGFLSDAEREFFNLLCLVDGVGPKKALRALGRPVREIAAAIEDQDVKFIASLPGVGPSTAERIVAKLRRKVPKFALIAERPGDNAEITSETLDVIAETFDALIQLGNTEGEARRLIDKGTEGGKQKFKDTASLIAAIYKNR